jgi:putative oxidoreductase
MNRWKKICEPTGATANILIRLVVGGVFLNEGILKFLYPVAQASGRFAKSAYPIRIFLARLWRRWKPFVGRWSFWVS